MEGQFPDSFAKDPLGGLSPLKDSRRHGWESWRLAYWDLVKFNRETLLEYAESRSCKRFSPRYDGELRASSRAHLRRPLKLRSRRSALLSCPRNGRRYLRYRRSFKWAFAAGEEKVARFLESLQGHEEGQTRVSMELETILYFEIPIS